MSEVEDIVKCSECNSRNLNFDSDKGELYCIDCGLVLQDEMLEATSAGKENRMTQIHLEHIIQHKKVLC